MARSMRRLMRIRLYGPDPSKMVYKDLIRRWKKGVKTNRRPLYKASTIVVESDSEELDAEDNN